MPCSDSPRLCVSPGLGVYGVLVACKYDERAQKVRHLLFQLLGRFRIHLVFTNAFVSRTHSQSRKKLSHPYLVYLRSAKPSSANAKCALSEGPTQQRLPKRFFLVLLRVIIFGIDIVIRVVFKCSYSEKLFLKKLFSTTNSIVTSTELYYGKTANLLLYIY